MWPSHLLEINPKNIKDLQTKTANYEAEKDKIAVLADID